MIRETSHDRIRRQIDQQVAEAHRLRRLREEAQDETTRRVHVGAWVILGCLVGLALFVLAIVKWGGA